MNTLSNRSLAGSQAPAVSIGRDVVRIVMAAVLAGTGFALLLALAVLSLTVIAPPAQASGAPTLTSAEPNPGAGIDSKMPGKLDAAPIRLAAAPISTQPKPADPPLDSTQSQHKADRPVVLYLVLALVAGFLAFLAYSLVKRKS